MAECPYCNEPIEDAGALLGAELLHVSCYEELQEALSEEDRDNIERGGRVLSMLRGTALEMAVRALENIKRAFVGE
jgi:hypothetical protein